MSEMLKVWRSWVFLGVLAIIAIPMAAGAQSSPGGVKDDLFAGTEKFAQGATGVSEISMDPDSLGLVNGDHAKRAHNLVLNIVRSYEYDKPGMYRMEDVEAFRKKLDSGDWRCSVRTRDLKRGDSTDVCNRRRSDGLVETAIITVAPKSLTFIHTVRKPGDDQSYDGLPALSGFGLHLGSPSGPDALGTAQLAMIGPLLDSPLAGLGDRWGAINAATGAGIATREAEMAARMAALRPEMEARIAEMRARMEAEGIRLNSLPPQMPASPLFPGKPAPPSKVGKPALPE